MSYDDTFACRQPISLDYNGCFLLLKVFFCFSIRRETDTLGTGDAVFLHQTLGEDLACLYLCRRLAWPKGRDASLIKAVNNAVCQWVLRANNDKLNLLFFSYPDLRLYILSTDIYVLGDFSRAGVAGGNIKLGYFRTLGELPGEGVLPAPTTNNKYLYLPHPLYPPLLKERGRELL